MLKQVKRQAFNLPALLAGIDSYPKFYFRCKDSKEERAAFGSIERLSYIPEKKETYYGAIPFDTKKSLPTFFLPEVEIVQKDGVALLSFRKEYPSLKESFLPPIDLEIRESNKSLWIEKVEKALAKIQREELSKIVLANKTTWGCKTSSYALLAKLLDTCPKTSSFLFEENPQSSFLGSTPEKLFLRKNRKLLSEAIAGTRKRGKTKQEDHLLLEELQRSTKDQKEVFFVQEFLKEKLSSLCTHNSLRFTETYTQTNTVQHLRLAIEGTLLSTVKDKDLVSLLHPTPAVCGTPSCKAKEAIEELETFDRGLYAGLIGWTCPNETSLHVAIRSALLENNFLHLFAGAGIVLDSNPAKEWEEIEHKIAHWRNLCR